METKRIKIKKRKTKIVDSVEQPSCDDLKRKYETDGLANLNIKEYNNLLRCTSTANYKKSTEGNDEYKYLYPIKDDVDFNLKIASKKEFYDNRYEEKSRDDFENIKQIAERLCNNTEFELSPHQMFVRNFMSFETPYNSLLLYHGLGTGKTCSAISVCEDMRRYLKEMGITKRLIIVASPAVQENFKIQLFDERKLKLVNGLWNIKACTGNRFIKEINPMNMKGLDRTNVIRQIKRIISNSYHFQGYVEFSNYIQRIIDHPVKKTDDAETIKRKHMRALKKEFSNRMLVIDEVHNLRVTDSGKIKPSSMNILKLAEYSENLKLLVLSATPMFNSYLEIVWLINLLNLNDKRYTIKESEIFDKNGNFLQDERGIEIGKELFIQKVTGYISYVRGNNPFTFPYSIYPNDAKNEQSLINITDKGWQYPRVQLNGAEIVAPIESLDLTMINIGEYQYKGYQYILNSIKQKYPVLNDGNKGVPYTALDAPRQALNIVYPHKDLETSNELGLYNYIYGSKGLSRVMLYDERTTSNFKYKDNILQDFGKIFSFENIGKYSSKIEYVCKSIMESKGIIFVYSEYIYGGAVPMALALEELGFTRYGKNKSLFETPPTEPIDSTTMRPKRGAEKIKQASYIMITGDKNLSPDIKKDIKAVTGSDNINGEKVKVIIVSRAGSEGLDFKNIREMHILDPWYNLNRQEQIIGRAVRNLSHCALPFEDRNVSIFLYGTVLPDETEAADLFIYRLAEEKARKMATVSRVLKENAIDCLLNKSNQTFTVENIDKQVQLTLSTGKVIDYSIGDRDGSLICDFTKCAYYCNSKKQAIEEIDESTYNENFITMNIDKIIQRIRLLYKEQYVYEKSNLIAAITQMKRYPLDQIYSALDFLTGDNNEYITDMFNRLGVLVNIGRFYLYQPVELADNKFISIYDRTHPVAFKRQSLTYKLPDKIKDYEFSEEKQSVEYKEDVDSTIFDEMEQHYKDLDLPKEIDEYDKENWIKNAAWAIYNINKWQKVDKLELISFAIEHVIDTISFKNKKKLLNYITLEPKRDNMVYLLIKAIFDKYTIIHKEQQIIVLPNLTKDIGKLQYTILILGETGWSEYPNPGELKPLIISKFQIKDFNLLNDTIGFMIEEGQTLIFKTKYMKLSSSGRTNKGKACPGGQSKSAITERINSFVASGLEPIKYKMKGIQINSIFGNTGESIVQKTEQGNEVKISSFQLCTETELILRYYDSTFKNEKRWFLNNIEAQINKITKQGKQ